MLHASACRCQCAALDHVRQHACMQDFKHTCLRSQELRTLIGIDQDETAFAIAEPRLAACDNAQLDVRLRRGNFR